MKSFLSLLFVLFVVVFGIQDLSCRDRYPYFVEYPESPRQFDEEDFWIEADSPRTSPRPDDVPPLDFSRLTNTPSPGSSLFDTPPNDGSFDDSDRHDDSQGFDDDADVPEGVSVLFPTNFTSLDNEGESQVLRRRRISELGRRRLIEAFNRVTERLDNESSDLGGDNRE